MGDIVGVAVVVDRLVKRWCKGMVRSVGAKASDPERVVIIIM